MTRYATIDPTTGKVVREFATMSDADVQQALDAYRSWRESDLFQRAAVLSRVADLHRQHATELAGLDDARDGQADCADERRRWSCRPRSSSTTPPRDRAVGAAVAGRFGNAGQACTSSKRLIVEERVGRSPCSIRSSR